MGIELLARLAPLTFGALALPWSQVVVTSELERRRQIDNFTAGGGFKLGGSPRQQQWFMNEIKEAMRRSPSFGALMFEIRADSQHPVDVKLSMNQAGVFIDDFDSNYRLGAQELDIGDLAKIPVDPPAGFPNAVTRGEVLVHAMSEARKGSLGVDGDRDEYKAAHVAAIDAQNRYRDEQGQKGHRRHPPDDGGYNAASNWEMRYDNGYSEVWVKGETARSISTVNRSNGITPGYGADDMRKDMEAAAKPGAR
jgi:hypothetical protein